MMFNLWQVEGVGKSAEVIQHHKVPGTNDLKLYFEFAEHFCHLFCRVRPQRLWGGLICFVPDLPLPVTSHHVGACCKMGQVTLKLSCHGGCILLSKEQSLLML